MIKTRPGRGVWERLRDRPEYEVYDYIVSPIKNFHERSNYITPDLSKLLNLPKGQVTICNS